MFPLFRLLLPGLTAAFALCSAVRAEISQTEYRTALGSGALEWSADGNPQTREFPHFVPAGGVDGAHLVLPPGTVVRTVITGPRLVRVVSQDVERITVDRAWASFYGDPASPPPVPWMAGMVDIPAGTHVVEFLAGASGMARLDTVELVTPPKTRAEALGLPGAAFTFGGTAVWKVAHLLDRTGYGVAVTLSAARPTAWIELPVTGPASVDFRTHRPVNSADMQVMMDGVAVISRLSQQGNTHRLEIPSGKHKVLWHAQYQPVEWEDGVKPYSIGVTRVTVNAAPGGMADALDGGLAFLREQGGWEVAADIPGSEGGTAVRPVSGEGNRYGVALRSGFQGPGFLDFRWWLGEEGGPALAYPWYFGGDSIEVFSTRETPDARGWQSRRVWFPPGRHTVLWFQPTNQDDGRRPALDGVRFTPTAVVPLKEGLDAPGLTWTNDARFPWTGAQRSSPEDDVGVSPKLAEGQRSRLATTVQGPGFFWFRWGNGGIPNFEGLEFRVGGRRMGLYSQEEREPFGMTVQLPFAGPVTLEWILTGGLGTGQVFLDQVAWTPMPKSSLTSALDAGTTVTWTTSATRPFSGRPVAGALNGTAAFTAVKQGETAWLEAKVTGPGLFDFWVRDASEPDLPWLWDYLSLTIDGKPVPMSGDVWPAQWIPTAGTHRIRFTFRNPADSDLPWIATALDEVTWRPQSIVPLAKAGGLPTLEWRTGAGTEAAQGYSSAGRDGQPAILLPAHNKEETWLETTVRGPCVLSWNSSLGDGAYGRAKYLLVDGVPVDWFDPHAWSKARLTLPDGPHTVRWSHAAPPPLEEWETEPEPMGPIDLPSSWLLSGFTVSAGISPLADALDNEAVFAFELGDAGGERVEIPGGDAWRAGPGVPLIFFDPVLTGMATFRYGHPDSLSEPWWAGSDGIHALPTAGPGMETFTGFLEPEERLWWIWQPSRTPEPGRVPPLLDALVFDAGAMVPQEAAMDTALVGFSGEWRGRRAAADAAAVGDDFMVSGLTGQLSTRSLLTTVQGPARVRFRWKLTGPGRLSCWLDGAPLPLAPPGAQWSTAEFEVGEGAHALRWEHSAVMGAVSPAAPSEAGCDALEILPGTLTSVAAAVTADPVIVITPANPSAGISSWDAVAFAEPGGSMNASARIVSGERILQATITGPVVLEFTHRCFHPTAAMAGAAPNPLLPQPASYEVGSGNYQRPPEIGAPFLSVSLDDTPVWRSDPAPSTEWLRAAVHVPAGSHRISFRINVFIQAWDWFSFARLMASPDRAIQAWVDDLKTSTPAAHYAAWIEDAHVPDDASAPEADADGDGASNFSEYLYQTHPRDSSSRSPALALRPYPAAWLGTSPGQTQPPKFIMDIPFVPALAGGGYLEWSTDLRNWTRDALVPRRQSLPPREDVVPRMPDTATHHSVIITPDAPAKYYRMHLE